MRVDYFLIYSKLTEATTSPKYHNILISVHSRSATKGIDVGWKKPNYNWPSNLLNDKTFFRKFSALIKGYLTFNDTGNVLDNIVWETLKVVIRDVVLSCEATKKKKKEKKERDF